MVGIFLHFLNREIYRAVDTKPIPEAISRYLRILSVARVDTLFSNYSNLLEGGYLATGHSTLAHKLVETNQLQIAGERPSIDEFLESRIDRYKFDAKRYPMYFSSKKIKLPALPALVQSSHMTDYLHKELIAIHERRTDLSKILYLEDDASAINSTIDNLREILDVREDRAITRSLFQDGLGGASVERARARLISSLYIRKFLDELDCDIAVGIPQLLIFDGLSREPHSTDVQILAHILAHCGLMALVDSSHNETDYLIATLRGTESHRELVARISFVCNVFRQRCINSLPGSHSAICIFRDSVTKTLGGLLSSARALKLESTIYLAALRNVETAIQRLRDRDRDFSAAYENQLLVSNMYETLLIVTAADIETRALNNTKEKFFGKCKSTYLHRDYFVARELGILNRVRVIHVQCEPGSVGPSSSQSVITDAIDEMRPDYIVLAGIAFGTDQKTQRFGDILVSKMIVEYEKAKVKSGQIIPRGQKVESSAKLLSFFRAAKSELQNDSVSFGTMLSGEKLIDSRDFLNLLLQQEPEAIGGEMEGAGLVAAAGRRKVNWIVVKAIVDWAHKKSQSSGKQHQLDASQKVFEFVFSSIESVGL